MLDIGVNLEHNCNSCCMNQNAISQLNAYACTSTETQELMFLFPDMSCKQAWALGSMDKSKILLRLNLPFLILL